MIIDHPCQQLHILCFALPYLCQTIQKQITFDDNLYTYLEAIPYHN